MKHQRVPTMPYLFFPGVWWRLHMQGQFEKPCQRLERGHSRAMSKISWCWDRSFNFLVIFLFVLNVLLFGTLISDIDRYSRYSDLKKWRMCWRCWTWLQKSQNAIESSSSDSSRAFAFQNREVPLRICWQFGIFKATPGDEHTARGGDGKHLRDIVGTWQ